MVRFILLILLLFMLYYILLNFLTNILRPRKTMTQGSGAEELVQDPYCQIYIPKRSAVKKRIAGSMRYFCNQECLKNYLKRDKEEG
jgi:YHS domain-containing protein